ncbi:S8 family serine peptidase [Streptomyces sp. NBC_00199]|uniref:S8 family serine peptidase n=1 Tax=Streptomyces sp. NBC_00199 TaxID=2975678 RepID=UPI00225772FC|nr:S8 family serine peptidase [Streptomyces sp. NBC_00199]MCX5262590.1 S8 family serine peptidase [Streptomyces sp. NBC_00199]
MQHKHQRTRSRPHGHGATAFGIAAVLALAGLTATATVTSAAPAGPADVPTVSPGGLPKPAARVTLLTGDTVTVDGHGRVSEVRPGQGRSGIGYSVRRFAGHTYVVPLDATRLLGSGRLDRRLFDVTQLVEDGYDDAHRKQVPLIVSYDGSSRAQKGARDSLFAAEADVTHRLPAIHGDALAADKPDAGKVWRALTDSVGGRAAVTAAPGIDRVWLDGRVRISAQDAVAPDPHGGVTQIGAPTAWKAGYDGKGVKVAVLDTGIDATHPDLKGRILKAKNFTGSDSADNRQGHGTHVASTIVGSGVKSGGKYKGVAPGAGLLVGKVLDDTGFGDDSTIIAGMQWAVARGAKVVNMSLGSPDTADVDPLEKAVNDLSASSHTLFVIAAGNSGPSDTTLGTPGSAAAALTVAAVDRDDKIASWSSRGPTADGRLKPDIAAPGVDIIAAKAAHGIEGNDEAPGYVSMSGTSMATPHTAGAAAIVAQEHPDWTGEQLKSALTASAKTLRGVTAYDVGVGRVDLTRATDATVGSEPSSVDFGTPGTWPHNDDTPVTRTLTYRNDGSRPVTLDLDATATGPGGKAAPTGMVTVSPARLTVPAGRTAKATVTADTRLGSADGVYSGAVTASGVGQSVRTALVVDREVETHTLTLVTTRRDGRRDDAPDVTVAGLDTGKQFTPYDDGKAQRGTVTLRLPKGRYVISATTISPAGGSAQLVAPHLVLDHDTTVALDGRKAKPVKVTAPDRRATLRDGQVVFAARGAKRAYDFSVGAGLDAEDSFLGQVGPNAPVSSAIAQIGGVWQRTATSPSYTLVTTRVGGFFDGLTRTFASTRSMARVNTSVATALAKASTAPQGWWTTPGWPSLDQVVSPLEGPLRPAPTSSVVQYLSADHGMRWYLGARTQNGTDGEGVTAFADSRRFEPGRTHRVNLDGGVHGPIVTPTRTVGGLRVGRYYALCVPMFSDGAGDFSYSRQIQVHTRLTSGSKVIGDFTEDTCPNTYSDLRADTARYKLSVTADRSNGYRISEHVEGVWTFTSANTPETQEVAWPLSVVRFHPKLSLTGTAKAGARITVPLSLQGPAGAKGHLKSLAVKVSYDGGRTWKPVTVHNAASGKPYLALTNPKQPGTVSFRAGLADTAGNTYTGTIRNAYRTVR